MSPQSRAEVPTERREAAAKSNWKVQQSHTVYSERRLPAFSFPRPLRAVETALWKANPGQVLSWHLLSSSRGGHKAFTEALLSHGRVCSKFLPSAQRTGKTDINIHCSLLLFI